MAGFSAVMWGCLQGAINPLLPRQRRKELLLAVSAGSSSYGTGAKATSTPRLVRSHLRHRIQCSAAAALAGCAIVSV